ncbi:hypothetical protein LUZ60_012564 [Juncus effusus]|nr:hypothetical protein LUZ60_012564 [Juncus effusus]
MKSPSVAALWASTPPSHQITSAVVLPSLSALFTGGSDGAIIRWSISGSSSVTPVCLLSGHAAAICCLVGTVQSGVLSCCVNGVLCVWDGRASSRCKRRRKLPPWSGTPLVVKTDPVSERNVLVLCGSAEMGNERGRKYVVLMIDCVSLTVVKTVFHGGITVGFPLEMGVFGEEVYLVDGTGRLQLLDVVEISDAQEGSVVSFVSNSSDTGSMSTVSTCENSEDSVQAVIFDREGKIVVLVYASKCLFKWVNEGNNTIGEISVVSTSLFSEESKDKLTTGIFLHNEDSKLDDLTDGILVNFALCSTNGAVILFNISISRDLFKFEPLCEIPPISTVQEGKSNTKVYFSQFNKQIIRIESNCFTTLWRPQISTWSFENYQSNPNNFCNKISSGGLPCKNPILNEKIVTSSLILSEENSFVPHSIIYGFNSGEIEVISFMESKSKVGTGVFPYMSDKIFSGHTGPILCLATHLMHSKQPNFTRALISGSQDCTVRIWDLDSGILLSAFHHHVKPVFQILLPPEFTSRFWNDCFLSVGQDGCVALLSLETMRVERVLTGHLFNPSLVAWDGNKGYIACLCKNNLGFNKGNFSVLYIWDLKTGACERIINGSGSDSMFDHFCNGIYKNALTGSVLGGTTSASSLLIPVFKDQKMSKKIKNNKNSDLKSKQVVLRSAHDIRDDILGLGFRSPKQKAPQMKKKSPIKPSCPFPGIASLQFDLSALMCHRNSTDLKSENCGELDSPAKQSTEGKLLRFSLCFLHLWGVDCELDKLLVEEMSVCKPDGCQLATGTVGDRGAVSLMFPGTEPTLELWKSSPEFCAMRSLTMVSLAQHMISLSRSCANASSALAAFYTRIFAEKVPDIKPPSLQLLVSFWQHECEHVRMAARSLFHCAAPRALPPPLSRPKLTSHLLSDPLLDTSSTIRELEASSINHSTPELDASSIIQSDRELEASSVVRSDSELEVSSIGRSDMELEGSSIVKADGELEASSIVKADGELEVSSNVKADGELEASSIVKADGELEVSSIVKADGELEASSIVRSERELEASSIEHWLDSYEEQEWVAWVGATNQDTMAANIIVAAALVVWYPSIVKESVASTVLNHLIKLLMSMNERYSTTAAELLSEGMESTWIYHLRPSITHFIGDIFFQVECLFKNTGSVSIKEALVDVLLPSLAMADVLGFLGVIEGHIWGMSSDSVVHVVGLKCLVRVVRGAPKILALNLEKVINYVLHTMDPSNLVMRKNCIITSMMAIREITRVFPMVSLNESVTRLAVGDAIGDLSSTIIRIYDLESVTKIRILDASAPPGLPILLERASISKIATAISALSFSPDGEGLVAFSENGLMIRWWSFGTAWWERLSSSRSLLPVQCTKLIFVPPWDGFSPNSSRSSIMSSIGNSRTDLEAKKPREIDEADHMRVLVQNLDLSYRLQWVGPKAVKLTRYNQDLGTFPLS